MCARVGYIQRNKVQCNFVPIVYTYYIQYYTTYLQNCMDLCIIRYAEVNHNTTEDYVIFDCQLRIARDQKISFVIERQHFRHLLNF